MTQIAQQEGRAARLLPALVKDDFPFFQSDDGRGLAYLDNAATTQKPQSVLDAIVGYYTTANSNIGRGYYRLAFKATDVYEEAREAVRRWLNAEHSDEIIFTRRTTEGTNLLADTFAADLIGEGDQVVVTGMEHNSNMLPWRRVCERNGGELVVVRTDGSGRFSPGAFAAALGPRVRLAAITHVSNVTGTVSPVAEMTAEARAHGIPVVVDGAQAVAHRPVDVRALGADFYCFSGHKVYGPMGSGVLYGKRELLHRLPPYQVGGGTVKAVNHTDPVNYVPPPPRLEAGTPDIASAVGLGAALRYLGELGWDAVRRHDEALVRDAVTALEEVDRVRVLGDPCADPNGIVSFVVEGLHPYDVTGHLDSHGIAARGGVQCANTFLDDLGLVGAVRLSFAVYNTHEDIERVQRALRTVKPGYWTTERPTTRFE